MDGRGARGVEEGGWRRRELEKRVRTKGARREEASNWKRVEGS